MADGLPPKEQLLSQARDIALIGAVFLYFTAFEYRWDLFRSFGVDIGLFDVPTFSMIVYAVPVVESKDGIIAILGFIIVMALGFVVVRRFRSPALRTAGLACAAVTLFVALQLAAGSRAQHDHDRIRAGQARNVAFTMREPETVKLIGVIEHERAQCVDHVQNPVKTPVCNLYLVADSKDAVYLLWQKSPGHTLADVIEIRKEDLASFAASVPL